MRCECCTRKFGRNEVVSSIRYGQVDYQTQAITPSRDSAPTLICSTCSSLLLKIVYQKLNPLK